MRWSAKRPQERPGPEESPRTEPPAQAPESTLVEFTEPAAVAPGSKPILLHALDGFLSAGAAPRLAAEHLIGEGGEPASRRGTTVATFDIDRLLDYRARRPGMVFDQDHYSRYETPSLTVRLLTDETDRPYLLLAGPEPDFRWEGFIDAVVSVIDRFDVSLTVGLGAVPMGVPHTRPAVVTSHATKPSLLDRTNLWRGQLVVPASASALLEFRLGQQGYDALGYVAHVPHYLAQVEFPSAAVTLLEVIAARTGLSFDLDPLRSKAVEAQVDIDRQITDQDAHEVVTGLEQAYDAFTRGADSSLLAQDGEIPDAEELGRQVEQFLAGLDRRDDRD
ncbi:MAG: PAC2 family protein [Nocardioidaceae bacterium]